MTSRPQVCKVYYMPTAQVLRIMVTRHADKRLVGMWQDATPMGAGRLVFRNPYTGRGEVLELGQYT